jgi:hypothetical protein
MKVTLTNGKIVEMAANTFGQVRPEDLVPEHAPDEGAACELLGVAPCEMRYGYVAVQDQLNQTLNSIFEREEFKGPQLE